MYRKHFSLYARPSFLEGIARLVDICGTLNTYNASRAAHEADYRAILADWESVGQDFYTVITQLEKDQLKSVQHG